MNARLLASLACLVATAALAQSPRVASLDWMSGTWVHESPRGKVTESWVGPANGILVAANLSAFASGKNFYEFLRIADTADAFSYYASPAGRPPVEFPMKEIADKRVVFENAQRDYPRRILYWRDGERLVARIEGVVDGKERSEEWRFTRVP
jgi:hypothetical protein